MSTGRPGYPPPETRSQSRARTGWIHFLGNLTAVVLALISLFLRVGNSAAAVLPGGVILSIIIVAILLVTGWMGGELAYRHKIGVIESD
jgi:uncharacterized membrane protein